MTISVVGTVSTSAFTTSGTWSVAPAAGDLLVVIGMINNNSTLNPPAGYTIVRQDTVNPSAVVAYKVATGSEGTTVTFPTSCFICGAIYRESTGMPLALGATVNSNLVTGGSSVTVPAFTTSDASTSWVVGFACIAAALTIILPANLTGRSSSSTSGQALCRMGDTNGAVSSYAGGTATSSSSGTLRSYSFEVKISLISASLNKTEDNDTLSATAALAISASANIIEQSDTASGTSALLIQGGVNKAEDNDTLAATAKLAINASATIVEANDTLSATTSLEIHASTLGNEENDTLAAMATIISAPISGTLAVVEDDDTLVATVSFQTWFDGSTQPAAWLVTLDAVDGWNTITPDPAGWAIKPEGADGWEELVPEGQLWSNSN